MAESNSETMSPAPQSFGKLSVSGAALRLRLTYNQTRDLLLSGKLRGGKDDLSGSLWIETASVEEYQAHQGAA